MKRLFFPLVSIIAFVLTACGSAAPTTAQPPAATQVPLQPTAATVAFPHGRFIKEGSTSYGLMFNEDGTFTAFDGDMTFVHATYKVEGNTLTETSNDAGCKTNVSFQFTFDGSKLTFNYAGDPNDDTECAGRKTDFNNGSYILTPLSLAFPTGKFMRSDRIDPVGFIFKEDGTWESWDKTMSGIVKGTYRVDGTTYTELTNNQCQSPLSFNYTFDGQNLTFSYVGNPANDTNCEGRSTFFDNVTYIRAEK